MIRALFRTPTHPITFHCDPALWRAVGGTVFCTCKEKK